VIVVYWDNKPVACSCFKYDANTIEIKRMFVPDARGKGLAQIMLLELEAWAMSRFSVSVLETLYKQEAAVGMYQRQVTIS
jgi:GNAT superfamily N-acetyltransferase